MKNKLRELRAAKEWSQADLADQLDVSPSRLYALATAYLCARAKKQGSLWLPGRSGGNHAAPWPQLVLDLLDKRLNCSPPCPYSFVASEALRLHHFKLDRILDAYEAFASAAKSKALKVIIEA